MGWGKGEFPHLKRFPSRQAGTVKRLPFCGFQRKRETRKGNKTLRSLRSLREKIALIFIISRKGRKGRRTENGEQEVLPSILRSMFSNL